MEEVSILKWIGIICAGLGAFLGVAFGAFGKIPKSMKVRGIWLLLCIIFMVLGLIIIYIEG